MKTENIPKCTLLGEQSEEKQHIINCNCTFSGKLNRYNTTYIGKMCEEMCLFFQLYWLLLKYIPLVSACAPMN